MTEVSNLSWDPGLQLERTLLAWRRTSLSLTMAFLIGLKLLPPLIGPLAFVGCGIGITAAAAMAVLAQREYRLVHAQLKGSSSHLATLRSGFRSTVLSGIVLLTALLSLAFVLTSGQ